MRQPLPALIFLLASLVAPLSDARAEGVSCGDRDRIITQLQDRFQESRHGIGIAANNSVLEIFASETSGTFSVLVTLPSGQTCLIASGADYQNLADPLPAQGKGA